MRAAREHPRVLIAKALGLLCLVGCGLAVGLLLGAGDDGGKDEKATRTRELRLTDADRKLRGQTAALAETRALLERSRAARTRIRAHLGSAVRRNTRLQRDLRVARRALVRARR